MVMSDTLTSFCCTVVFTPALFSQFLTTPWFSPTMPPMKWLPYTTPRTSQSSMSPETSLRPAMPPTTSAPLTTPEKQTFCSSPALIPATPPTVERLPSGVTVPVTVRLYTSPLSCTYRNSPCTEPSCFRWNPEMV